MSPQWSLSRSFRDLPVSEHVEVPRRAASSSDFIRTSQSLEPSSGQLDMPRLASQRNSVMFSCTLPAFSLNRKESKKAKELERKKSLSKGKDRYTIVKGLAGGPDGISFESLFKKKHFLRARNGCLILELYDDSEEYRKQATFIPLQDMWFSGYIVFESLLDPAHFIRRCNEQLILQKYENSQFFKEDASFKLTRKRCIACVKIGSRVWAKAEKGCYLRGIVVAVDDDVHVKLENGSRVKHKKSPTEVAFVPDIIPHPLEIEVGTRVLARWFNRLDTYYPAIVTGIRRTYYDVRYDDGDKGSNVIAEIRLLKLPEVEGGTSIPSWSSLDGLPRVGGLCIESTDNQPEGTPQEQWVRSPRDSPVELTESPSDLDTDKDGHFGYENNFQHLTPDSHQYHHAPVERNFSQVQEKPSPFANTSKKTLVSTTAKPVTIPCQTTKPVTPPPTQPIMTQATSRNTTQPIMIQATSRNTTAPAFQRTSRELTTPTMFPPRDLKKTAHGALRPATQTRKIVPKSPRDFLENTLSTAALDSVHTSPRLYRKKMAPNSPQSASAILEPSSLDLVQDIMDGMTPRVLRRQLVSAGQRTNCQASRSHMMSCRDT
ncbi:uncharacterized protein LOC116611715 isoform X4 [Nematostella vectensis]|uniref:uncharacterized protein LOC116611715 isoform X4 n=1 Tax=Nematostella vectensis TaxID=45351 RepID=UPI00138FAD6B|nr:uncharacterized protein LOC116611715 isoform X4 [Nematostella vectensis]